MLFPNKSLCNKKQRKVVSREEGNQHIIENRSQYCIYHYHIDGGIIPCEYTSGERCDYMVEVTAKPRPIAFIIELKGSNLLKAMQQIDATVKRFGEKLSKYVIFPRLVCHRILSHDVLDARFMKFIEKYPYTRYGARILSDTI